METSPRYALGLVAEARREPEAAFNQPTRGTSVERFKEMVISHLKVSLQCVNTWLSEGRVSTNYSTHTKVMQSPLIAQAVQVDVGNRLKAIRDCLQGLCLNNKWYSHASKSFI